MSRRIFKVALLVLLVAGVLGSGVTLKGAASKLIPMIALFSGAAGEKITGDGGPYVHQGTTADLNNLAIDTDGHFIMVVRAVSGRFVNLLFDTQCTLGPMNPDDCPDPDFLVSTNPAQTNYWALRTYWKCRYIPHNDETGSWTELIRSTTRKDARILNLKTMAPGETVGVSVEMMRFQVGGSEDYYGLTGQPLPGEAGSAAYLLVTATDWDGDGAMDWILRTIPGKIVIKEWDRTCVLLEGDCFRLTSAWPCEYGSFRQPFELKVAPIK